MNTQTMRTAALYGKQDLRVAETNVPKIDAGELLLQVKGAFVCGTDVRMYYNGYQGISETTPMILGHEGSGVVTRCRSDVKNFKEGMRVAIAPNVGCGICDYCVSGNTHLCLDVKAVGIHMPGFFAEYVKIPENFVRQGNVLEIPDSMSFEEAALAEPLACVFNAFEKSKMRPGETVLVIGAGPIGLMHLFFGQGPLFAEQSAHVSQWISFRNSTDDLGHEAAGRRSCAAMSRTLRKACGCYSAQCRLWYLRLLCQRQHPFVFGCQSGWDSYARLFRRIRQNS